MIPSEIRAFGETSNIIRVYLQNDTTGAPLTGLTHLSSGLFIVLIAGSFFTGWQADNSNIEDITTPGVFEQPTSDVRVRFKAYDGTNAPGLYEIHIYDSYTSFSGAKDLTLMVTGAANLRPYILQIQLRDGSAFAENTNSVVEGIAVTAATAAQLTIVAGVVNNIYTDVHTAGVVVAAGSKTGYSLAGTQTFNNTGTWTGNLSGSVGSVAGNVSGTVHALDAGAIVAGTIADGALVAAKFGAGFILKTSFAADAFEDAAQSIAGVSWSFNPGINTPDGGSYGDLLANFGQEIESGITAKQALRAMLAVAAGNSSGGGTGTVRFKAAGGSADRVVADVDANGNRTNATITA